jgi:hypothetical protein
MIVDLGLNEMKALLSNKEELNKIIEDAHDVKIIYIYINIFNIFLYRCCIVKNNDRLIDSYS